MDASAAAPAARRRRGGWIPAAAALVLVAGLAVAFVLARTDGPELDLPRDASVAVLPFAGELADPELAWIERGLPELVFEVLDATEGVAVVPRERLATLFAERELATLPDDLAAMHRVAWTAGADLTVDATLAVGRGGAADYRLAFTVAGPRGAVAAEELAGDDPVALADELGRLLAAHLSRRAPESLALALTPSPFLARLYAMGVQELAGGDPAAAQQVFELCLRYDPRFVHARSRLADAEEAMGRVGRGRELRQELLAELESRGRRELQGRALLALGDLSRRQRRLKEALGLFTQAHTLFLNARERWRQAEALGRLAELATVRGERGRAEELTLELVELRRALGDELGEVEALGSLAELAFRRRDYEAAADLYADARERARRLGDAHTAFALTERVGDVAARQDDDAAAIAAWREAYAHFAARDDRLRRMVLARKLGDAQLREGELDAAEERFQEILEDARARGAEAHEALASMRLAEVLLRQGYPYQARDPLRRALELDRHVDDRVGLQVLIAWLAYEQGNARLAAETQAAAKRQARPRDWDAEREAFLAVYERALATGERIPLPGVGTAATPQSPPQPLPQPEAQPASPPPASPESPPSASRPAVPQPGPTEQSAPS